MRSYENHTEKLYNIVFKSQEERKCQNKVNLKRNKNQEPRGTLQTLPEQSSQKMLSFISTVQDIQKETLIFLYLNQNSIFKSMVRNRLGATSTTIITKFQEIMKKCCNFLEKLDATKHNPEDFMTTGPTV